MYWSRSLYTLSRQICAVPDLCCIVSRRLIKLVGGVFDPLLSSAIAVFEHVKDVLWPCYESNLDAAVSRRDRRLNNWADRIMVIKQGRRAACWTEGMKGTRITCVKWYLPRFKIKLQA